MTKKCVCSSPVPNFDGTCITCSKLLDWNNTELDNVLPEESFADTEDSKLPTKPIQRIDLPSQLRNAANDVVRFSKIFKSIGDILNILNYVSIGLMLLALTLFVASGAASGSIVFPGLLLILAVWVILWLQTALLRGLATFFLMRGLRELKDLEAK